MNSAEYRPGYVHSLDGPVRVQTGQVWRHGSATARVVGLEDGAVFLSAEDETTFRATFTRQETDKHGQSVNVLPFKEMGSNSKKPDEWKNGTFAAHEAWDVWRTMTLEP